MRPKSAAALALSATACVVALFALALHRGNFALWTRNQRLLLEEPRHLFGGLDDAEGILAYLERRPGDVALVCLDAAAGNGDGSPEVVVEHNPDEPMPLASTMKVVVLAAYAREVVAGRRDPEEAVSLEGWERYYLPGTDGGAHAGAMEELGLPANGADADGGRAHTVPLERVVRAMIRFSDNAATDYLLDLLGDGVMEQTALEAGLSGQEPIRSLVGEDLSRTNHEHPRLTDERLGRLLSLHPDGYRAETERYAGMYLSGPWGEAERRFRLSGVPTFELRNEVRAFHELTPRGTASDYARTMLAVASGTFVSPGVSRLMRGHLEWPMEGHGEQDFRALGAKGGSLPGILTDASYCVPARGELAGRRRAVALFLRGMPLPAWLRLNRTFAQQDFALRLATDAGFARRVASRLGGPTRG